MGLTRKRTLYFVTFLALVVLSLRPVPEFERAAGLLLAPLRVAVELVAPLAWVTGATGDAVRAAVGDPAGDEAREREACAALLVADQASARPTRAALRAERLLIHAEVVGRRTNRRDRVVVELPRGAAVAPGMPVVHGDHYVGRVARVAEPRAGEPPRATVELVTAADFRIGARMSEAPFSRLVVGGLAPVDGSPALLLAPHKPADRDLVAGGVEVDELDDDASGYAGLADGYRLGELFVLTQVASPDAPRRGGTSTLAVRPGLDYQAGLYQLVVLGHAAGAREPAEPDELRLEYDPFDPSAWLAADVALGGDPSFWREGRKLEVGRTAGVAAGAAVRSGARFVGRVVAVQALTADVALLGDRGLELPGLAWIDGRAAPFSLGRLVGLGRTSDGDARLRWDALVPLPPSTAALAETPPSASGDELPTVRATLFTGSGEPGVPRGLFVGEVRLPAGPGPHELVLVAPGGRGVPSTLQVRVAPAAEGVDP